MAKQNIEGLEKQLFSDRERVEIWIAENWKKCIIAAAVVVVVVVAVFAWTHLSEKKDADFRAKLAAAKAENIAAVIAENPGHPAVAAARMRLARDLQRQKKYTEAIAEYQKIASDPNAAVFLRESAKMDAAACFESIGDIKNAIANYSAVMADSASAADSRAAAGFAAGRLLLAQGNIPAARDMFAKVAQMAVPGSDQAVEIWAAQSRNALAAIKNGDFAKKGK